MPDVIERARVCDDDEAGLWATVACACAVEVEVEALEADGTRLVVGGAGATAGACDCGRRETFRIECLCRSDCGVDGFEAEGDRLSSLWLFPISSCRAAPPSTPREGRSGVPHSNGDATTSKKLTVVTSSVGVYGEGDAGMTHSGNTRCRQNETKRCPDPKPMVQRVSEKG